MVWRKKRHRQRRSWNDSLTTAAMHMHVHIQLQQVRRPAISSAQFWRNAEEAEHRPSRSARDKPSRHDLSACERIPAIPHLARISLHRGGTLSTLLLFRAVRRSVHGSRITRLYVSKGFGKKCAKRLPINKQSYGSLGLRSTKTKQPGQNQGFEALDRK